MPPLEYAPKDPAPRSTPVRFLFRHNPFYLLSAMCMLAGCLSLTNSLSWTSIGLGRLLALVVTLNVYEGLLLGLGLYLLARRGVMRDGIVLLFLEAMFLVDAAFLNVEVFAVDVQVGLITNAVVYLLALAKLFIVFKALGLRLDRTFGFVLLQVTTLFLLPGTFAVLSRDGDGSLPPRVVYAAWWAVAALGAVSVMMVGPRDDDDRHLMSPSHYRAGTLIRRTLVVLPVVSLLTHLVVLHWVYDARLFAAYVSPVLLALAVVLGGAFPAKLPNRAKLALLRAGLPVVAVLMSMDAPNVLRLAPLGGSSDMVVSPLMLSFATAYLVYIYLYFSRYAVPFLAGSALAFMAYAFGPSPSQVAAGTKQGAGWGLSLIGRLVPSTTAGWGVTAVFAAFAFLGIGAAISLRKPPGDDGTGAAPQPLPVPAEPPLVPGLTDGDGAQGDAAPAVT